MPPTNASIDAPSVARRASVCDRAGDTDRPRGPSAPVRRERADVDLWHKVGAGCGGVRELEAAGRRAPFVMSLSMAEQNDE